VVHDTVAQPDGPPGRRGYEDEGARATALPRGFVPELDGLRGVAILLVIASHYLGEHWRVASLGWTGVSLFFVLSGFLITGILLDAKDKPHYFRNFYARRTLRIFPLYYLVLFLMFVVAPLFPALDSEGFRSVAQHQAWLWTYTMNIHTSFFANIGENPFAGDWVQVLHFWSLSVEEQFYLVWPLVVLLTSRRQLIGICVACFFGACALRIFFAADEFNPEPYFFTLCRLDDLAAGAFIAAIARGQGGLDRLSRISPWIAAFSIGVLITVGIAVGHFFQLFRPVQIYAYSAFTLLYMSFVVFALTGNERGPFRWLMRNPVLRSYGTYSYAIYIFHWGLSGLLFFRILPLDRMTDGLGSQDLALGIRAIAVAIISWGIAWVSWHAYEKHFLKLKTRFYSNEK
jgi:peptidoglycan/LPS O-acetylase OafA/YrhL